MASQQQQPRPLFRFATLFRPAAPVAPPPPPAPTPAPAPVQQPTLLRPPPLAQPLRPQVPPPQPTQPPTAPVSPARATRSRSPGRPSPQVTLAAATTPKSPAKTPTQRSPAATPAQRSLAATPAQRSPAAIRETTSPITKSPSSSPTSSPTPKASPTPITAPAVASTSQVQPSPQPKASAPSPSRTTSSTQKPVLSSQIQQTNSPAPKYVSTSPTKPNSPAPKPTSPLKALSPTMQKSPIPSATVSARTATPVSSSKVIKPSADSPPKSPIIKPVSHPPSPLTLPPAQIKTDNDYNATMPPEVEQKTVLVQETTKKHMEVPNNSNANHVQRFPVSSTHNNTNTTQNGRHELKRDKGSHKKHSESEEFGMRVVTLAGENKGAIMELSPSRKKYDHFGRNPHNLQMKGHSDGEKSGSETEGKPRINEKSNKTVATRSLPITAFMNSNVQGVNNSILYNCSCTHNDPGVHLSLSRKANGGHGFHLKDRLSG